MIQRLPRQLDRIEVRVLGCLLEKQQATPEYYPLTLNALVAACNQKSNRDPVLNLSEREVSTALRQLGEDGLVRRDDSGRATRWSQKVDRLLRLDAPGKAALTVLLLRGPQTAGEVRSRTTRLHPFDSSAAAEAALAGLAGPPDPLILLLERAPGQKEARWGHRLGIDDPEGDAPPPLRPPSPAERDFDPALIMLRIDRLEQEVEELKSTLKGRVALEE
jgi:uncharacterized protein YceH (UPF0502 family)